MIVVQAGSFTMGSPSDEPERRSDEAQVLVTILSHSQLATAPSRLMNGMHASPTGAAAVISRPIKVGGAVGVQRQHFVRGGSVRAQCRPPST
jgi:hypothetical protein